MLARSLKLAPLRCRIFPPPPFTTQSRSAYVRFGPPRGAGGSNYQRFSGRRRPSIGELWENPRFRLVAHLHPTAATPISHALFDGNRGRRNYRTIVGGTAVGGVAFYA